MVAFGELDRVEIEFSESLVVAAIVVRGEDIVASGELDRVEIDFSESVVVAAVVVRGEDVMAAEELDRVDFNEVFAEFERVSSVLRMVAEVEDCVSGGTYSPRILLTRAGAIGTPDTRAMDPFPSAQQVIFMSSSSRGQKVPSLHLLNCAAADVKSC